jgi:acyl dehydratase
MAAPDRRAKEYGSAEDYFDAHEVHVGMAVGGREFTVSTEDVAGYVAGTGTVDLPGIYAPPLLYHSEVYRSLTWYLPNIIGNLHARQEWEFFRPLQVGDAVRSHATVVDRYRKRDRLYVVNEVLLTDGQGRWLQRSRTHQSFLAEDPSAEIVVDRERERRTDRRFQVGEGEGEDVAPLRRTVTQAMCEAFSGPAKTYHTDREMALALGFPDIVVQGMMSICLLSDMLTERFGLGWLMGGKLDVRLINVVWVNDTLALHGKIRSRTREGTHRRALLDVWCAKGEGTVALVGTASALE